MNAIIENENCQCTTTDCASDKFKIGKDKTYAAECYESK